ncbi:efflux RND transporter periplasmic adaptor subunit [Helicobacter sp.]|uniref:efflux RND transporter periplasmic adaptor subunit n=1 Tax=Helicobacter sp. TaxID=218 RepID=UPI0025C013FF|nr:efflux RND transporter periplasmic adaptor subunit [Helicobacter sp.]MBR2494671.1 efflux RND transporter periplasmic adaptor subunit [Helicobacter sp.]
MKKITTLLCIAFLQSGVAKSVPVESVEIKYGALSKIESFVGIVRFKEISSVATSAQGVVQRVYFSIGDNVKKGQRLISLDSALLLEDIKIKQAKIADARYTLERQKNELERYKNLLQSQSISIQQYENLEYEVKSQEARIQALLGELAISKVQKNQKVIYAPFDGIVVEQRAHEGEWVQTGAVVCQILNSRDTEVIIDVPSSVARALSPKQKVKLIIGGREYQGAISALIPRADTLSRTFPVYIAVRNDGSFLDGMAARALLDISGGEKGFIVPRDSIVYKNNATFVFAIRAQKAVRLPVKILATQDSKSLVSGALKTDDLLVLRGQDNLSDNAEVRVVKRK